MLWYVSFLRRTFSFTGAHGVHSKIGGSYATSPRQAERRTPRNFFPRDYPYAWTGGRIVYDVAK
jgi:hypothetical protein